MRIPQEYALELFKIAVHTRDLEIKLFWQRSLFFAGFIAAVFVALNSAPDSNSQIADSHFVRGLLLVVGTFFSLAWCLANRGGKYWQESWEQKVDELEQSLDAKFFAVWMKPEKKFFLYDSRLYSVSKLATFLSDLVLLAWVALVGDFFYPDIVGSIAQWRVPALLVPVLGLLALLLFGTRTSIDSNTKKAWKSQP